MFRIHLSVLIAALLASPEGFATASNAGESCGRVIAHEWGTFTSIAAEDGTAVEWLPQDGPVDLPCFVERLAFGGKPGLLGTVRMETPVLYFYASRDTSLSVRVRFPQGLITEWFPRADVEPARFSAARIPQSLQGTIEWPAVRVAPAPEGAFPVEAARNHYYAARHTDAVPVQVGSQRERFLFYRGVGAFQPPLQATVGSDNRVTVRNVQGRTLGTVMLFENRGGRIAYKVDRVSSDVVTFRALPGGDESASPKADLQGLLISEGLYPREAKAMIDTWDDSWFEEGSRLLYILSAQTVDEILPLEIRPAPTEVRRVFVGRMELITAATRLQIREALRARDTVTLSKYSRFLQPIGQRVVAASGPGERAQLQRALSDLSASPSPDRSVCR